MKKKRNKAVDYVAYLGLRTMEMLFHMFPIDLNLRTGKLLGSFMWFAISRDIPLLRGVFRPKHREQIFENLRTAFGDDCDPARLEYLAKSTCQHLVMFAIECLFTTRLITISTWQRYVKLNNFQEALRLLLENRNAIMVTGHYGSWEALGFTLACVGFESVAIYRPLDNPYIDRYLKDIRQRRGLTLLSKKGAAKDMHDILESGKSLGFIADQDAGRKGIFVDFFGKKASTYKSIALLAREYNLPIIVGCARRRVFDKFLYEIDIEDIIYPADWAEKDNEVLYITERFNRGLENMIRKDPRQYLWLHRRWKTRPKEERNARKPQITTS